MAAAPGMQGALLGLVFARWSRLEGAERCLEDDKRAFWVASFGAFGGAGPGHRPEYRSEFIQFCPIIR